MSTSKSKIEWTDATWNPVVGCSKVSPGCDNCYAVTMAGRLACMADADVMSGKKPGGKAKYRDVLLSTRGPKSTFRAEWSGDHAEDQAELLKPLRWTKPRKVFVVSMGDLFHETVAFEMIAAVFGVMAACERHTFQVLTKRPERMAKFFEWIKTDAWPRLFPHGLPDYDVEANAVLQYVPGVHWETDCDVCGKYCKVTGDTDPPPWPLPNVWIGVTAENQEMADLRIPKLLNIPAAVRFVSVEPMLGPVDLVPYMGGAAYRCKCGFHRTEHDLGLSGYNANEQRPADAYCTICDTRAEILPTLDWVICGGESGPGARPMHPAWARDIRDQCKAAAVPFMFKQWGEYRDALCFPNWTRETYTKRFRNGKCRPGLIRYGLPDGTFTPAGSGCTIPDHTRMLRVGKKTAGRIIDAKTHDEYPKPE